MCRGRYLKLMPWRYAPYETVSPLKIRRKPLLSRF